MSDMKRIRLILCAVYAISLVPLVIAGFYNYPSADDFSMGIYAREVFVSSGGNVFAVIGEAFYRSFYYYMNWMGYFFASFVMVLTPSIFGERFYFLSTPVLLLFYTAGVLFFTRQLFTRVFKLKKETADVMGLIILIITVQCMMEGLPRVESFFWYVGSANYTMLYGIGLIWLGLMVRLFTKSSLPTLIPASVLAFLMGGANYMTALSLAVVSALMAALAIKQKRFTLVIPCALEIAGLVCSGLAPGNAVRLALLDDPMNPVKAIFMALYYTFSYCFSEWTTWAVIALILLASPFIFHAARESSHDFSHPVIVCALSYGLISCNIVPPLYAMRNIEAGRMQSVIFEQYILLLVLTLFYCMGFFAKRSKAKAEADDRNDKTFGRFYLAGLAFALFGAALSVYVNPHVFSATGALIDVVSGDAKTYHDECLARQAILKDDSVRDVYLEEFSVKPLTLFYDDIRTDTDDWENTSLAAYYGKDSVTLTERRTED